VIASTWRRRLALVQAILLAAACAAPGPDRGAAPAGAAPGGAAASATAPANPLFAGSARGVFTIVSIGITPLWLADEVGLWKRHGLDLDLTLISGGTPAFAALVAGEVQFAHIAGETALGLQARDPDLVGIANYNVRAAQRFIARPEIQQPRDLADKRIGIFAPGDGNYTQWAKALRYWGFNPERDVVWQSVGGGNQASFIAALAAGSIDAAMLLPPNDLPALKNGAHVLAALADFDFPSPGLPAFTARRTLDGQQPLVEAYLKGVIDGVRLFYADPALAKAVLARRTGIEDQEAIDAAYNGYAAGNFTDRPFIDYARMRAAIDDLAVENPEVGQIVLERAYDNRALAALEAQGYFARP
jgi:NitT/TauT family transport system substrate-binding protein